MSVMKKVLVPTDFSANSKHALHIAANIAVKNGAELGILHVNTAIAYAPVLPEYEFAGVYNMQDYYDMAVAEFRHLKQDLVADSKFAKLDIETRIEEGLLYSTIRRVAEGDNVNLIVMGTKGASGALEFFVGSNTEKVIRTACCPVLAVPVNSGDFNPKAVVLASTLAGDQEPAFRYLAEWQKHWPFKVKVLYLNNPGLFRSKKEIDEIAAGIAEHAGLHKVSTFININSFNEESSILEFAQQEKADLIVMATHQRKGLSHLLFGSLAEDTSNHSTIPVLSIPVK